MTGPWNGKRRRSRTRPFVMGLLGLAMAGFAAGVTAAAAAEEPGAPPFDQGAAQEKLRQSIAGKEEGASGEVWKNVQILKGVPAGRLLKIMEIGYSRSLGVTCTHCHDVGKFEADDKKEKQIAREMAKMMTDLNGRVLPAIPGLKSERPTVNCTTCHRGEVKPALDLK